MIAIKDIEMPSSCYDCPFVKNERTNDYGSFCECGILEDYETINLLEHSKHPNCPLIEQEPCEDAIGRQAAIKAFQMFREYESNRSNKEWVERIEIVLNQLPPVNPQPEMGHWTTTRTFMHDGEYYCDKCKCDAPNNERWDYCPNCGAKMIEWQESEEV